MSRWPKTEKAIFAGEVTILTMALCTTLVAVYASFEPFEVAETFGYDFRSVAWYMLATEGGGLAMVEYFKWYIKNH